MTDEVKQAREFLGGWLGDGHPQRDYFFASVDKLIAAVREECAVLAEDLGRYEGDIGTGPFYAYREPVGAAIRRLK